MTDLITGVLVALLLVALLIGFVFATGQTFGQRCAAAGFSGAAFESCVNRLVGGGAVKPTPGAGDDQGSE